MDFNIVLFFHKFELTNHITSIVAEVDKIEALKDKICKYQLLM